MRRTRPLVPPAVDVLQPLVDAGVLQAGELAVADAVARHGPADGRAGDEVVLGVAIAALGLRMGHSCVDLADATDLCRTAEPEATASFAFPTLKAWTAALAESDCVQLDESNGTAWDRPVVLDAERGRLWLTRYAHYEHVLCDRLVALATTVHAFADDAAVDAAVRAVFAHADSRDGPQPEAVKRALTRRLSFVIGGPGTGKTWTVGRLLEAFGRVHPTGSVALAAPTGKAAERLTEAVGASVQATTIHRLLGMHPSSTRGVDPPRRLGHDLIVVDESSMIDLPMMTRLVGAVGADAHLVFVGDPDQLLSVEVGSVLRDVVDAAVEASSPLHGSVTELQRSHRFGGALAEVADAIRRGDGEATVALLDDPAHDALHLIDPDDAPAVDRLSSEAVRWGRGLRTAAERGASDAALELARSYKVLTGIRAGRFGLEWWNDRIATGVGLHRNRWSVGRPVIVTRNDPANGVFNGDTGITVADPADPAVPQVALAGADGPRLVGTARLRDHEDWWAMTIHKSQGSEFDRVVVSLPRTASAILSRELLYTAVTRAREQVTIIGSREVIRSTAERRIERASGLRDRLSGGS
jgi:exodeoxyribonuclease V alpha subunit